MRTLVDLGVKLLTLLKDCAPSVYCRLSTSHGEKYNPGRMSRELDKYYSSRGVRKNVMRQVLFKPTL